MQIDISLIKPELIVLDAEVSNRDDLFDMLERKLSEYGYIKPTWLEAVKERERRYPTGLACPGIAVAIPHTDPEHLVSPYIAIVRPANPVAFAPMGGIGETVQAELVVNLGILAHAEDQVAVLQALMEFFMDEEAVACLMRQSTPEGTVDALARFFGSGGSRHH